MVRTAVPALSSETVASGVAAVEERRKRCRRGGTGLPDEPTAGKRDRLPVDRRAARREQRDRFAGSPDRERDRRRLGGRVIGTTGEPGDDGVDTFALTKRRRGVPPVLSSAGVDGRGRNALEARAARPRRPGDCRGGAESGAAISAAGIRDLHRRPILAHGERAGRGGGGEIRVAGVAVRDGVGRRGRRKCAGVERRGKRSTGADRGLLRDAVEVNRNALRLRRCHVTVRQDAGNDDARCPVGDRRASQTGEREGAKWC